MITNENFTKLSYAMAQQFENINTEYLQKMGEHIQNIGKLTPSDLHRLEQMNMMSANVSEINRNLRKQCGLTVKQLNDIYKISGAEVYSGMSVFYKRVKQLPFSENKRVQDYIESVSKRTAKTFENLANTTVITPNYRKLIDRGIFAVTSGVENYNSAIRKTLKDASMQGIRATYESTYTGKDGKQHHRTRKLDSAVRMNILEGMRQVEIGVREITGVEFGADGYEISAHALCATDHIPIQGLQLSKADYEDLNADLVRPVGELNCHHTAFPIVMGVSEPTYSQEELARYKQYSKELIDVGNGRFISRYDVTQLMRQIETQVRYAKDNYIIGKAAGNKELMIESDARIKQLQDKYLEICNNSGLEPEKFRMTVPGFKREKARRVIIS